MNDRREPPGPRDPRSGLARAGRDFGAVTALLEDALAGGLGSAAAVSIGDAHQELHRCCRGALWRLPAPGPRADEDCWFDLASLTKPMVSAALAMVFADRGRLALDEPVRRWVPEAATPGSVAELLGHAAGCAAHVKFFEQLGSDGDGGRPSGRDPEPVRRELLRLARVHPLAGVPGRDTAYSDLGYMLLGELLERVGGARLDELYAAEVARPLGLGAHYRELGCEPPAVPAGPVVATELLPAGLLVGEVHDENARVAGGIFGHAGLFGRIGDVADFARAMLALPGGGGLVRPATAAAFFERSPGGGLWRLGWTTPSPESGVSHAGDRWPRRGVLGHLGFTGTSLWLDLPRGRWVALLTNRVHPTREGSAEGIKQLRRAVMDTAFELLEA